MIITELEIPKRMEKMRPILKNASLDNIQIIGVDTETCEGPPITMQFFGHGCGKKGVIKFLPIKQKTTRIFLDALDDIIDNRPGRYLLVGFNLKFDMLGLFHDRHEDLLTGEFEFTINKWLVKGVYDTVFFATFTKSNHIVHLIDGALFYTATNLANLAKLICPQLPKLTAPEGLGSKYFKASDRTFVDYAMRDAEIAYYLGLKILDWHREFNVDLCVSSPHFASKIFLKKFLKRSIELPPRFITDDALASYHGGKNNLTQTGIFPKIYSLDIVSAYPAAMQKMPSFSMQNLYKRLSEKHNPKNPVPEYGVYTVSGICKKSLWPIIYDHDFIPQQDDFYDLCITGFEYNQALKSKHAFFSRVTGYYYDAAKDKHPSPLKAYSDYFFKKKAEAIDKQEIYFFKILLNALYGKFIQNREESVNVLRSQYAPLTDESDELKPAKRFVAGGLFNPFIASMITGSVRAKIHEIELKYKAIHTATDGIFTTIKPAVKDLSKKLGGLKLDAEGELLLVRSKCYILYCDEKVAMEHLAKNPDRPLLKSGVRPGRWILKFATHAYYGKILDFERMIFDGKNEYECVKVNQLKESYRRGLVPNKFERRNMTFNYKRVKTDGN